MNTSHADHSEAMKPTQPHKYRLTMKAIRSVFSISELKPAAKVIWSIMVQDYIAGRKTQGYYTDSIRNLAIKSGQTASRTNLAIGQLEDFGLIKATHKQTGNHNTRWIVMWDERSLKKLTKPLTSSLVKPEKTATLLKPEDMEELYV
ncbi:hypothetical protein ACWJJH_14200 [Endozoicomonadaceae bacterium StTr2]